MAQYQKIALLFPGQGAQYPGMGKDFFEQYPPAKETFQHADDILHSNISNIIFNGPQNTLTETKNSQLGIYIVSLAIWRVVKSLFPNITPYVCAGLSLGEYSALTAAERLAFDDGLSLVQMRGQSMNDACEATKGTMMVVVGMDAATALSIAKQINLPDDLWIANFNCPGQVVFSGTLKGIEAVEKAVGAIKTATAVPLPVHGAFHSGLMKSAGDKMFQPISQVPLKPSQVAMVMNVNGDFVSNEEEIRQFMIKQITSSVKWEQGIRKMDEAGVDLFIEMGCGTTLAGFNKRIRPKGKTISLEKVADLDAFSKEIQG